MVSEGSYDTEDWIKEVNHRNSRNFKFE